MLDKTDIRHIHWQLRLGESDPASGEIVTGYDDIDQEIRTIILTPIGSVPTNPLKGCDLLPWIDRPPAIAIPRITQAIWDALTMWVTRIEVQPVTAEALGLARWRISVPWRVRGSVAEEIRRTELTLGGSQSGGGNG